jgi:predicted nucleic acid-binding protein
VTDKVIDASAMAAVVFDELDREIIEPHLAGATLFAPLLFRFEMASVCLKKIRAHPREQMALVEAFEKTLQLPVAEMNIDLNETITLAFEQRLSLYDASYLWLARHLGVELVTLDEKLQKAATKI